MEPLALVPPASSDVWPIVSAAVGKTAAACWRRANTIVKKFPEPRRIVQIAKAQAALPTQKRVAIPADILNHSPRYYHI